MAKFDPKEFNYEIYIDDADVLHYQKHITTEKPAFADIIELVYWKAADVWVLLIKTQNLKQFLPDLDFSEDIPIILFIGKLKTKFDFKYIFKKIVKDPELIIKLGC